MMDWTLVTGGAKGLGREICLELARQGFSVLVHYKSSRQEALAVVEACRHAGVAAEAIQGDFSSPDSVLSFAVECRLRFPSIKNLINNVGNYLVKSGVDTTPEEWTRLFQTNVLAPITLIHELLPGVIASKGSIINIGVAGVGCVRADVKRTAFTATKMALLMATKSLARELAPSGVRVNMVSPGHMEHSVDLPKDLSQLPMGRPATFEEVTRAVLFLLRGDNSYITGQNIEVGGGIAL